MEYFKNKKVNYSIFLIFIALFFWASFNLFKKIFLNEGFNADEYYLTNVYNFKEIDFIKITSIPSQLYILLSSLLNSFINDPKMATRSVSLLMLFFLVFYFSCKIKRLNTERFFKFHFFVILTYISIFTKQCFTGTSDFLAIFFLLVFILELNEVIFEKNPLTNKQIIFLSSFLALSIITRPTVLVILSVYSVFLLIYFKRLVLNFKLVIAIPLITILIVIFFNLGALLKQGKIILDVKEVPENVGTNWLERNYLMAKFWDEGKIPKYPLGIK